MLRCSIRSRWLAASTLRPAMSQNEERLAIQGIHRVRRTLLGLPFWNPAGMRACWSLLASLSGIFSSRVWKRLNCFIRENESHQNETKKPWKLQKEDHRQHFPQLAFGTKGDSTNLTILGGKVTNTLVHQAEKLGQETSLICSHIPAFHSMGGWPACFCKTSTKASKTSLENAVL